MGFFSGIGKIFKKIVRVAKKVVKGAIGTVKGALKGDPLAMASLAMMVYGGYQAGQFLFNKAALGITKATAAAGSGAAQSFAGSTAQSLALGTSTQVSPMMTGLANISGSALQGGVGAVAGAAGTGAAAGTTSFWEAGRVATQGSGLMPSNVFTQAPSLMSNQLAVMKTTPGGALRSVPTRFAETATQKGGFKSFFDPKGLATSGARTAKKMAQGQTAMAYSQREAALEQQKQQQNYYDNYMAMSQQMFERFGGGQTQFSASSTPMYAIRANQGNPSYVPPNFKPYFQYAAGTSNFGAATNILNDAINTSYIRQYA